jgi:RNA methyltransferase, TrmH family
MEVTAAPTTVAASPYRPCFFHPTDLMLCVQTGAVNRNSQRGTQGDQQHSSAVFDGFHAWKHGVRFGFAYESELTTDRDRLVTLAAELAPDLVDRASCIPVVTEQEFRVMCIELGLRTPHHTGVMAWGQRPAPAIGLLHQPTRSAASTVPAVLVDGARHPGNLGAVVRVAAAAHCPAVFATGGLDPWHPDVVRGAAGLHAAVPVLALQELDAVEGPLFALDADGVDIGTVTLPAGAVLAVGAERDGVSEAVRRRAAEVISLPMRAGVSSLNLATAVAAALYRITPNRTNPNRIN